MAADALSRQFKGLAAVATSSIQPAWLDRLQAGYEDDEQEQKLIE